MSDKLKIMQEPIVNAVIAAAMSRREIFALDALLFGNELESEDDAVELIIFDQDFIDQFSVEETVVQPFFAAPWGIDVSHYQGNIDWGRVAEVGVEFAFIKATEGVRTPTVSSSAISPKRRRMASWQAHTTSFSPKCLWLNRWRISVVRMLSQTKATCRLSWMSKTNRSGLASRRSAQLT